MRAAEARYLGSNSAYRIDSAEGRAVNTGRSSSGSPICQPVGDLLRRDRGRSLHSFSRHELEEICQRRQAPEAICRNSATPRTRGARRRNVVMFWPRWRSAAGLPVDWHTFAAEQSQPWLVLLSPWWCSGCSLASRPFGCPGRSLGSARPVSLLDLARLVIGRPVERPAGVERPRVWIRCCIALLGRSAATGRRGVDRRGNPHDRQRRAPRRPAGRGSPRDDRRSDRAGRRDGVAHHDAADGNAHAAVNTPWEEVVESVIDSGHTRVPVYDKIRDDIVGILYSKDLLPELAKVGRSSRAGR